MVTNDYLKGFRDGLGHLGPATGSGHPPATGPRHGAYDTAATVKRFKEWLAADQPPPGTILGSTPSSAPTSGKQSRDDDLDDETLSRMLDNLGLTPQQAAQFFDFVGQFGGRARDALQRRLAGDMPPDLPSGGRPTPGSEPTPLRPGARDARLDADGRFRDASGQLTNGGLALDERQTRELRRTEAGVSSDKGYFSRHPGAKRIMIG